MKITEHKLYGDFLDGFAYKSELLLHTNDNEFWIVPFSDIMNITHLEVDIREIKYSMKKRYMDSYFMIDQFMTDFDVYDDHIYFCNSDGVFGTSLKNYQVDYKRNIVSEKIWDAPVQCIRVGSHGRIGMSASGDGLFEYDLSEPQNIEVEDRNRIEKEIHQITEKHSTSCRWTYGCIWNHSIVGESSLFEYRLENNKEGKQKFFFRGEYHEEQIFKGESSMDKRSLIGVSSQSKSIYRFKRNEVELAKFSQAKDREIAFSSKALFGNNEIGEMEIRSFEELHSGKDAEDLFACETESGIAVIDRTGRMVYKTLSQEDVVNWRTFPNSKIYRNYLLVVYNDRIEIVEFE